MTCREAMRTAVRAAIAALSAWRARFAPVRDQRQATDNARVRAQRARLYRGLPWETMARCRRVAERIAPRAAATLREPDGERAFLATIGAQLEAEGVPVGAVPPVGQIVAAILAIIAAVLILIADVLAAAGEDTAQEKEPGSSGHDFRLHDLVLRVVARLEKSSDEDLFAIRRRRPPQATSRRDGDHDSS